MTRDQMRTRLRELNETLIPATRDAVKSSQQKLSRYEKEATTLTVNLAPKKTEKPTVSDHALIRYLQRAKGIDLAPVYDEILTPTVIAAIEAGASKVTANGAQFVVQGKTIVTVVD